MDKWGYKEYQRIKEATLLESQLAVIFENGDQILIPLDKLVTSRLVLGDVSVKEFNPFEVILNLGRDSSLILPWDRLRVLTDIEFSQYLADKADEQAKEVGQKLKLLREKREIKANELAVRSGVTPQTISRIEKGHTDVGFRTLGKILASMGYSLKDLAEVELDKVVEHKTLKELVKKLTRAGIDYNLLWNKIIPVKLRESLNHFQGHEPELLLDEVASYVSFVFDSSVKEIWSSEGFALNHEPVSLAYFKAPLRTSVHQIHAYSHYAYTVARIAMKACAIVPVTEYPSDVHQFREALLDKYYKISLESVIKYSWDLGVCVLPLNDSGLFHGASWNIDSRHVIVLKQGNNSHARWTFDLLHELYHVFVHLEKSDSGIIEGEEITPFSSDSSIEESEANSFASHVIFDSKGEEIAEKCVDEAGWRMERLSSVVPVIAKQENIGSDFLANYLAHRLAFQGHNWWGAASNFQITNPSPFSIVCNNLMDRIDMGKLNSMEKSLLEMALNLNQKQ